MKKSHYAVSMVITLLLCTVAATACAQTGEEAVSNVATLGLEPDLEYSFERQHPLITCDARGYHPSGKKVLYIMGGELDKSFQIVDMTTKEPVYEGLLTKLDVEDGEDHIYIGDFSDYTKEGEYRVYQQDVGYSGEFAIDKQLYREMYHQAYEIVKGTEYNTTSELMYVLSTLLLTHEIYDQAEFDGAFVADKIKVLMGHQDEESGAVSQELQAEVISLSATAEYAGLLAQYYADFCEEDEEFALECLNLAEKAYLYLEQYADNVSSDSLYYASSQLYRATGQYKYRNAIEWYDSMEDSQRTVSDYDFTFLADVAYLKSAYRTDYIRCESMMNGYLREMVAISDTSDKLHYYVQSDIDELGEYEVLDNMMKLGLVSYVVSGREYASIQGNYMHYLLGLNGNQQNYIETGIGEDAIPVKDDIIAVSKLIFVLAGDYAI